MNSPVLANSTHKNLLGFPWCFLLPFPFAYWFGQKVTFIYLALLFVLFLTLSIGLNRIRIKSSVIFSGIIITGFAAFSLPSYPGELSGLLGFSPHSFLFLSYQALQLYALIVFLNLFGPMNRTIFQKFVLYLVAVLVLSILLEAFLVNVLHLPKEWIPSYRISPAYNAPEGSYQRPFGLVGSAPINGSALVSLAWLYCGIANVTRKTFVLLMLTVFLTLLVNSSGQALVAFLLTFPIYLFKPTLRNSLIVIALLISVHLLLKHEVLHWKVSYDYIERVFMDLRFDQIFSKLQWNDVLFGAMTSVSALNDITVEFYPIHMVARFGLFMTLIFWIFVLLPRGNSMIFVSQVAVFIGSVHYPAIQTIFLQIPLALLILHYPIVNIFRPKVSSKTSSHLSVSRLKESGHERLSASNQSA